MKWLRVTNIDNLEENRWIKIILRPTTHGRISVKAERTNRTRCRAEAPSRKARVDTNESSLPAAAVILLITRSANDPPAAVAAAGALALAPDVTSDVAGERNLITSAKFAGIAGPRRGERSGRPESRRALQVKRGAARPLRPPPPPPPPPARQFNQAGPALNPDEGQRHFICECAAPRRAGGPSSLAGPRCTVAHSGAARGAGRAD
ncbi:CCAAT/enhancer-binding protein beta-like [Schistocerca cancellata]|uniref:CCAAT/enhancer-binding protein beta-like n=1 Tax=Schistocerca cancellata TaxID=274614 RepID=UPI0021177F47|nr:CCAAT/enhancer-binding protein beta-like [Schistocerca cancellata]